MKQKFEQKVIFKENFKALCKKHQVTQSAVLAKLELPSNYATVLGLVRIANYFEVSISVLLEK